MRSYSQTTAGWVGGILQNDYGADLSAVQWLTFEDGHVAEAKDPPGVIRADKGKDITQMLIAGEQGAALGADAIESQQGSGRHMLGCGTDR